ncbi:alpha/beta hydrolase [Kineobactrum sediminis]|uniref:Alpha/beta hydrolase n=1 Tax=Kineobactrum sediminis TaxID=1905677 RepID=A0A2N5Y481_9GAMM|nr:alpha/beta hydrolase [Kineobactrum sediminis]PLW83201.1 alpha/beta hydrolase [Kineobactrum sediminis]
MQDRLEIFGGSGEPLLFAHANGYPPGSYRRLLDRLAAQYAVTGYRHRPLWSRQPAPVRADWNQFANDLIHTLERSASPPVWMMGHSLGGVVAMLAAIRRPELFRGVILLDPVFVKTRLALGLNMTPRSRLQKIPMIRRALNRPDRFTDVQSAFDFHRGKRAFSGFDDEVLWDYIRSGIRQGEHGEWELAYPAGWEAAVYSSLPLVWPRLLRLRVPTLGIRGETSDILSAAGLQRWQRLQPKAELHTLPGGHLFPLEYPDLTAERVLDFLARQPR